MTFDFLQHLSPRVYERYLTLEKNIKSASNSFYDAYLDLQEELLKHIIASFEIEIITRRTFGELLRLDEIKNIFLNKLGLSEYAYDKMLDYSLKINSHKHKGEKKIELDTVIKYISIFYEVSSTYARFVFIPSKALDVDYFKEIFNCFERENEELKKQLENYRELVDESNLNYEEKEKYRILLSYSEINSASLEEQNNDLRKRLDELNRLKEHIDYRFDKIDERLNRIENEKNKANGKSSLTIAEQILKFSKKEYIYAGTEKELFVWKSALGIAFFVVLIIGFLASYFATKFFNLYSTFTLFENIWLFLALFMTIYVLKAKDFYDIEKYKINTIERLAYDKYGVPRGKSIKVKYRVFLILSIISSLAHIFMAMYEKEANLEYATGFLVFEILFLVLSIAFQFAVKWFFSDYFMILHTVKNRNGEIEKYLDDGITGKLVPYKLQNPIN